MRFSTMPVVALCLAASALAWGAPGAPALAPLTPSTSPNAAVGLVEATRRSLQDLPPLKLPQIDPELIAFAMSYQFSGGAGELFDLQVPQSASNFAFAAVNEAGLANCFNDAACNRYCSRFGDPVNARSAYGACATQYFVNNFGARPFLRDDVQGFSARLPVFVRGRALQAAEGKTHAYVASIDTRAAAVLDRFSGASQFDAQISADILAKYKKYLDETQVPLYLMGQGDLNGAQYIYDGATGVNSVSRYVIPTHLTLGVGLGRIYAIEPRLRLRKLERMLLAAGAIRAPIDDAVGRTLILVWWALRHELGYDQRLLYTLKTLQDAGLLVGEVNQETVYRFGRIFSQSELQTRAQGQDSSLALRFGHAFYSNNLSQGNALLSSNTWIIEARHRQIFNLSYDSALTWSPYLAIAPRAADQSDNVLPEAGGVFQALRGARLAVNVPVNYRLYRYDDYDNNLTLQPTAAWDLRGRAGLAVSAIAQPLVLGTGGNFTNFMVGAGADYIFYRDRNTGYSAGVDVDVGYAYARLAYALTAHVGFDFGASAAYFVGPVQVVDKPPLDAPLPVDTGHL